MNGDVELYPNSAAVVKVNLTRSAQNTQDTAFNADSANEKQIVYTDGTTDDSVVYDKLLVYNIGNHPYTYKVTEQTVIGYSTTYDHQEVSATQAAAADRTVTITNTPLKSSAQFLKYDLTDLEKHGSESSFSLVTLPGAQFELWRKRSGQQDRQIAVRETTSGTTGAYTVVDTPTVPPTVITSGADGSISLSNLEPNEYYLKEIAAPTGYQTRFDDNSYRIFSFTVSVDSNNQISVAYDAKTLTKNAETGALSLDGGAFSADSAKTKLTDLPAAITGGSSAYGIPDEQNMSHLTLTKVDKKNTTHPLPNATYYLLRLYNYQYKKPEASGSTPAEYLTNALNTLDDTYAAGDDMWTYWEKVGEPYYTTGADGSITAQGHMFGTYVFYEVKAPVGYERDYTHNATSDQTLDPDKQNVIGPVDLHSGNAAHAAEVHNLTHLEPHKTAEIKILKTDENGNPLKGATFDLYKVKSGAETDDTLVDTVTTGYDGLNPDAIALSPDDYNWGQEFYFIETTPPKGYSADNEDNGGSGRTKISFTLTPELADETLHIVRANDARLKGKVTLTKTSSATTTTVTAGDLLQGAGFELYTKSGTKLNWYTHTPDNGVYRVRYLSDDPSEVAAAGYAAPASGAYLTTGANGTLTVEGLDWGDYYLKEVSAPAGFRTPTGEEAKVYFSVGRSNCGDTPQELSMKNDPLTAQLNIYKHIDQFNADAWGEPTFIFKIRKTANYDFTDDMFNPISDPDDQPVLTKTISPTTPASGGTGYEDATGAFEIEPGTYTVDEIRVARYSAVGNSTTTEISAPANKVSAMTNTPTSATFSVKPDGSVEVKFNNELTNYEKQSHVDQKTNRFNGYKALEVGDKDGLTPTLSSGVLYSASVNKSDLLPALIRSDGTSVPITDYSKLAITGLVMADGTWKPLASLTYEADEITVSDNGASITVTGRMEDISGSAYRLRAVYDGKFSDDFELRFAVNPLFEKTEKTVTFRNDTANKSYYTDTDGSHNGVYTLIYVMENPDIVKKILHNGTAISETGTAAFPALHIDSDFSSEVEFDHWSYTYTDGGTTYTASVDSNDLLTAITGAPDNAQITVTAVLRNKTP